MFSDFGKREKHNSTVDRTVDSSGFDETTYIWLLCSWENIMITLKFFWCTTRSAKSVREDRFIKIFSTHSCIKIDSHWKLYSHAWMYETVHWRRSVSAKKYWSFFVVCSAIELNCDSTRLSVIDTSGMLYFYEVLKQSDEVKEVRVHSLLHTHSGSGKILFCFSSIAETRC